MTTKIEQEFESKEWHDTVLLNLSIDRRAPGERDEVVLLVEWPDGQQEEVRFVDCYAFDAQMNFGVIAHESILAARCLAETPKLAEVRKRWQTLGVQLEDLRCFEIITNSTASEIHIYAERFEVTPAHPSGGRM